MHYTANKRKIKRREAHAALTWTANGFGIKAACLFSKTRASAARCPTMTATQMSDDCYSNMMSDFCPLKKDQDHCHSTMMSEVCHSTMMYDVCHSKITNDFCPLKKNENDCQPK
jgi:hypothetical protein